MAKTKRWIAFSVSFLIILITAVLLLFFLCGKFDKAVWKENPDSRVRMVDNFLAQNELKGKSTLQIEKLLGEPDRQDADNGLLIYTYHLGKEISFFGYDEEWLVLWFDDHNNVKKYELQWH